MQVRFLGVLFNVTVGGGGGGGKINPCLKLVKLG